MKFLKYCIWLTAAVVFGFAFCGVASAADLSGATSPVSSFRIAAVGWEARDPRSGATLATRPHDDGSDSGDDDDGDDDSSED